MATRGGLKVGVTASRVVDFDPIAAFAEIIVLAFVVAENGFRLFASHDHCPMNSRVAGRLGNIVLRKIPPSGSI